MINIDKTIVQTEISLLDHWIQQNGWAGYDPYDIAGQDWYIRLFGGSSRLRRKIRGGLSLAQDLLPPLHLRKILRIQKEINAKGMGLLASAYLTLSKISNQPNYLIYAEEILIWLTNQSCREYPGVSWGYPFHWNSRIFIPRGTPSIVVTSVVGDAFLEKYLLNQKSADLATANGIAEFILNGLNRSIVSSNQFCFSYTPLDRFMVHNANLFGAAFLCRLGIINNNQNFLDVALQATNYTLSEQNKDGSFCYWGGELDSIIDHYHTGFVLRHLVTIYEATKDVTVYQALERGYAFYLASLFTPDGKPKMTPNNLYPINIHSCSEAMLTLCRLLPVFSEGKDRLEKSFHFIQHHMKSSKGYYIASIQHRFGTEKIIDIPYLRWGQAWMFLALVKLQELLVQDQTKIDIMARFFSGKSQ